MLSQTNTGLQGPQRCEVKGTKIKYVPLPPIPYVLNKFSNILKGINSLTLLCSIMPGITKTIMKRFPHFVELQVQYTQKLPRCLEALVRHNRELSQEGEGPASNFFIFK